MSNDTTTPLEEYLDQPTIAKALGVDRRTVRRLILRHVIPPADLRLSPTLLRWKRSTIETFLASNTGR